MAGSDESFVYGDLRGSVADVQAAYRQHFGQDDLTEGILGDRREYLEMLDSFALPKHRIMFITRRLNALLNDLYYRESELGGAQSGVQWEYGVLVEAAQKAMEAGEITAEALQESLGAGWVMVEHSFTQVLE
ncbi:MAG: hypothetical protein HYS86_01950 [Candidatus Chisholmbacteria bacterium]|nr:hypothetical protein [Candidatus Chisholmbacteria bacterium]